MPFPDLLPDRQYAAPAAADGASITAVASTWTNTAWVTLLASAPSDGLLTGLTIRNNYGETPIYYGWSSTVHIDIGVGAGPTVIATFGVNVINQFFVNGGTEAGYIRCPIPIAGIVSGQPIKARLRQSVPYDTAPWFVAVTYLRTPLAGAIESTANPQYVLPASANLELINTGAGWINSPFKSFASSGDRVVVGVVGVLDNSCEIDIADATTVRATVASYNCGYIFPGVLAIPPVRVTGALRARMRTRNAQGSHVGLICIDAPL